MKIRKAVIPVAGLGTRFLPATKSVRKEMLTIIDRPLIQYAVDEALEVLDASARVPEAARSPPPSGRPGIPAAPKRPVCALRAARRTPAAA